MTAIVETWRVSHEVQLPALDLPRRYQGLSLGNIPNPTLRQTSTDYLATFWQAAEQGTAPGFFGRSGTYKTWAACVIAQRVHYEGLIPTAYVECGPEFARLERRRFDESTEERLGELASIPFLVLDDITDLRPGSFAIDMLDGVVKQRDADGFPTLFTGNALFSPAQPDPLIQQFGAAFTRRLLERTKGFLMVLR